MTHSRQTHPWINNWQYVSLYWGSVFFFFKGKFNDLDVAEGKLNADRLGLVDSVRLSIKSASKNWVIISEVMLIDVQF